MGPRGQQSHKIQENKRIRNKQSGALAPLYTLREVNQKEKQKTKNQEMYNVKNITNIGMPASPTWGVTPGARETHKREGRGRAGTNAYKTNRTKQKHQLCTRITKQRTM